MSGGGNYGGQLIRYNTKTQTVDEEHTYYFSNYIWAHGQAYVQIGNDLYCNHGATMSNQFIGVFNLATRAYSTFQYPDCVFSSGCAGYPSCFTHTDTHLIVLGTHGSGLLYTNSAMSFDLTGGIWDNIIPNMNHARNSHSCLSVNDVLYAFAGYDGSNRLRSLEKIDTSQNAATWVTLQQSLTEGSGGSGTRAVTVASSIFIIGGSLRYPIKVDTMHVVDVNDDSVVLLDERLPFAFSESACAISNKIELHHTVQKYYKYGTIQYFTDCIECRILHRILYFMDLCNAKKYRIP